MITGMQRVLVTILLGQAPVETAPPSWVWVLVALLILALGVIVWAVPRTRALAAQIAELNQAVVDNKDECRKLGEKGRKSEKDLEAKREEIKKLKKDLAGQRKKHHGAQEENRKLREDLTDQRSSFKKKLTEKPAFAGEEAAAPVAKKVEPTPVKVDKPKEPAPAVGDDEAARVKELNLKLKNELQELREETRGERAELRRLRKRVEDYRRIDIIHAGKREALEERVKLLGKQYYEAVTEIAVLKGEVPAIPAPEEMPEPKAAPKKRSRSRGKRDEAGAAGEETAAAAAGDDAEAAEVPASVEATDEGGARAEADTTGEGEAAAAEGTNDGSPTHEPEGDAAVAAGESEAPPIKADTGAAKQSEGEGDDDADDGSQEAARA